MNEPWQQPWRTPSLQTAAVYRARVRGCLLGGALGDALGYPVEFASLDRIRVSHGPRGVTGLLPGASGAVGLISDDTQMTLFTAEALIQAHARQREKGTAGAWPLLLRQAYERWLETQSQPAPGPDQPASVQPGSPAGGRSTQPGGPARDLVTQPGGPVGDLVTRPGGPAAGFVSRSGASAARLVPQPGAQLGDPGAQPGLPTVGPASQPGLPTVGPASQPGLPTVGPASQPGLPAVGPVPRPGTAARGLVTEAWLYARRAPGNACLSGVAQRYAPDPALPLDGTPGEVNPDSKGCGTVMRSAPFGLVGPADAAFDMAARGAQITHGHPTGYYAAGALAAIVAHLVAGDSLEGAVLRTLRLLERYRGHTETTAALREALDLAADGAPTAEKVESLGAGWVAEQALAIGVYCALAEPRPELALLLAVNHSGDSDSTGSICGNLLGTWYGDTGLPHDWVARVEGRDRIAALADDLAAEYARG
ncbi:hypothetical protein ADK64_24550 [Streptomyces sp. MMG1121]|nr:ADP-ribosylglycohydrolase family protein [Streptomyces sp. MMG1121]KOV62272.1 hypothetical protein ADK64_24550 [Streptomyces sp. MMG1121]